MTQTAAPHVRRLHRVFTNDWKHHGRFYGGWWQNIPKEQRARLLINGEDTAEHDYPSFHISLAYAVAGVPIPRGDLYELQTDRWPRNLVKLAANTMLNARDRRAALGAVVQEAVEGGILVRRRGIFANVSELLDAVERRHTAIQRAFFSDAGLTLMNVDSGMAERIIDSRTIKPAKTGSNWRRGKHRCSGLPRARFWSSSQRAAREPVSYNCAPCDCGSGALPHLVRSGNR